MTVTIQILCSSLICCMCLCSGLMFAWPSSTLRLFDSRETSLDRVMSETELALFGSLSSMGALLGTPPVGYLLDNIGRKYTAIIFSTICVISWSMISCSRSVSVVLGAVFVSGVSGAVFLVAPVYIGEVCGESVRGAMSSCTMVFFGIGMLVSYLLGGALTYDNMIYVNLGISVTVTAALLLLKESPTYLLANDREQEAIKSISYYRSIDVDSKQLEEQLTIIRQSLNPDMDPDNDDDDTRCTRTVDQEGINPEEEKLNNETMCRGNDAGGGSGPNKRNIRHLSTWQFIKRSESTRRALTLTVLLLTTSIFQGMVVLQVYAEPLFEVAVPDMSANLASILLALVAVLVGFIAAYLTDKAGRRPLMIYPSIMTGVSCMLLGLQLHLQWGPSWLVAVNIYMFTTMFAFGGGTVPYVLLAEVFLPQVKSILTMCLVEWSWFCNYLILFVFNPVVKAIGVGPCFYVFSCVSFTSAVYAAVYQPETKGLTVHQIQDKFTSTTTTTTTSTTAATLSDITVGIDVGTVS